MNQHNSEMFSALRDCKLPLGEYLIIGSGALGIRNLKAIGDIDIIVTPRLWDILANQYGVTIEEGVEKIPFPGGVIEAFRESSFHDLIEAPSTVSRIPNAEIIEGLPFDSLENVLFFKRKMGREKDLKDIQLIEIALYQKRLKLDDAVFNRIDHEDTMVAVVYKITEPNGNELILKICERQKDYLNEVHFLNFFAGKIPVPRIIQIVEADDTLHGAILMECLPGELLSTTEFTESLAYEMGANLARIHLNRTSSPDIREHFTMKFEEGMDENKDHLPKELLDKCRKYYESHVHLLDTVDGPCIIHRDFRAGNVIVDQGKISGIIDWSSARSSFAEDDFCPLEHGEWPPNPKSKASFLAGYASIRTVPNYQAIMPFLRLNKALATVGFTVKRGTWATRDAKIYQYNRNFLETFLYR